MATDQELAELNRKLVALRRAVSDRQNVSAGETVTAPHPVFDGQQLQDHVTQQDINDLEATIDQRRQEFQDLLNNTDLSTIDLGGGN